MQKTFEVINVLIFMLLQNLSIICSLQLQKSDLRTRNCKNEGDKFAKRLKLAKKKLIRTLDFFTPVCAYLSLLSLQAVQLRLIDFLLSLVSTNILDWQFFSFSQPPNTREEKKHLETARNEPRSSENDFSNQ